MKPIIGLQYLRGLAALMVVAYHLAPSFTLGASGVDVFFVISGFIIWRSTAGTRLRPWPWWRSRLIRIVPLYWIALVAMWVMIGIRARGEPGVWETLKAFLFIPTLNSHTGDFTPFLGPGWSLNYEFLFYLVMAALLFVRREMHRLALICLLFGALVFMRRFVDQADAFQSRMTNPLIFEFVGGICVSLVSDRIADMRTKHIMGALSLTSAALWLLVPNGPRIVTSGIPAALLVLGVLCFEDVLQRRIIRPLRALGDSSYSLYLSHPIMLLVPLGIVSPVPRFLVLLALYVFVGWLVFRLIERPLLRRMRGNHVLH